MNNKQHWYSRDFKARYGATFREARKEELVPSVTEILKLKSKPALENWKIEMAITAALTHGEAELNDELMRKIKDEAFSVSGKSADLGGRVHNEIESILKGDHKDVDTSIPVEISLSMRGVIEYAVTKMFEDEQEAVEAVVHNGEWGGRVDYLKWSKKGRAGLLHDFKTQYVRKEPRFYIDMLYQLGGYAIPVMETFGIDYVDMVSIIISTNPDVPGYWTKLWTKEERQRGIDFFTALYDAWCFDKNYYPAEQQSGVKE